MPAGDASCAPVITQHGSMKLNGILIVNIVCIYQLIETHLIVASILLMLGHASVDPVLTVGGTA